MIDRRLALLSLAAVLAPGATLAAPALAEPRRYDLNNGKLILHVVDLSPKFLAFYAAAKDEPDADKRFALWTSMYGFAAVPPGPRGDAMARKLVDAGWPKYPTALDVIRAGAPAMRPQPLEIAQKVAAVLGADQPMTLKVVAYVGAFDQNAFSYRGEDKVPVVCVPLEMSAHDRAPVFAHEMTHAVHMEVAHLSGGWERSIAATIMQEGLAMEVSRAVVPGRPFRSYIEFTPGWYDRAHAHQRQILEGLLPVLDVKDGEQVFKYTMGQGSTGIEREAYYAGWTVMEHFHAKGMTWAQIARIPEDRMPQAVGDAIHEILAARG